MQEAASISRPEACWRVRQEVFEGPPDLLLYLAKREEVDIFEVVIEEMIHDFLGFFRSPEPPGMDVSGEFILTAALLMRLKSGALLPAELRTSDGGEDDAEDPVAAWTAVRRLIEYRRFRNAARELGSLEAAAGWLFPSLCSPERLFPGWEPDAPEAPEETPAEDLSKAFQRVMEKFRARRTRREITGERFTVREKIEFLRTTIPPGAGRSFSSLALRSASREEALVLFLAIQELIRDREFRALQEADFRDFQVFRL